jgi:hypothetical protein
MSDYGKRGGTSANAGRKASTYVGTFPDGSMFRKRSFEVSTDEAHVGIYQHQGEWKVAGVARTAVMHDGALRPIYHEGDTPSSTQFAVTARRV